MPISWGSAALGAVGGSLLGGLFGGGGGGGGGGGPTSSTVTQTNIPDWLRPQTEAMLGSATQQIFNVDAEGNITGIKPYVPYSEDPSKYVAPFSPLQEQAFQGIADMQMPGQYAQASQATQQAMQQAMGTGYTPGTFANQYQAPGQYQTGQFGVSDVNAPELQYFQMAGPQQVGTGAFIDPYMAQAYMSPYVQAALDPQLAQMQRQSDIVQQGLRSQAISSGAFGGSRQALQASEQERNKQALMGQAIGQGYQSAYDRAMQQYSIDAARQMQAALANQSAGLTTNQANLQAALGVQQLGAGQSMQAQLANQAARQAAQQATEQSRQYGYGQNMASAQLAAQYGLAAQQAAEQSRQYGAGLGLQGLGLGLQAANQLAGIGGSQLAAQQGIYGLQQQAGSMQQQQQQAIINQAIQNYAMAQQYPMQQLSAYNALLRGYATPTTTVQQYQAAPSLTSQLGGLGTAAYGAYKLGTMKKGGTVKRASGLDALGLYNATRGAV